MTVWRPFSLAALCLLYVFQMEGVASSAGDIFIPPEIFPRSERIADELPQEGTRLRRSNPGGGAPPSQDSEEEETEYEINDFDDDDDDVELVDDGAASRLDRESEEDESEMVGAGIMVGDEDDDEDEEETVVGTFEDGVARESVKQRQGLPDAPMKNLTGPPISVTLPSSRTYTAQPSMAALSPAEFAAECRKELQSAEPEAVVVPSNVEGSVRTLYNVGSGWESKRGLNDPVIRWEYRERLDRMDVDGCGSPVCVLIDGKPKRFYSMCGLIRHLKLHSLFRQFFMVQKGDCADAIEHVGFERPWMKQLPKDQCAACQSDGDCNEQICVGVNNVATTFKSVCQLQQALHGKNNVVFVMMALGDCAQLLSKDSCLYTEWFDVDEPCKIGDTESSSQNIAAATSYAKTGRFRMCPRSRQVGEPEYKTVDGYDIPPDQKVEKDLVNNRLVCKNSHQSHTLKPPFHWFNSRIRCRDYKMRHCCRCLYGCHGREAAAPNAFRMDTPPVRHMFEECEWREFISHEAPAVDSWDGEDRWSAAEKYNTSGQVCGGNLFDAMFIDARRREDDVPWDETGEIITKNTPWYGFLCINKNNAMYDMKCSDYKVRYCCLKQKPAQWGQWSRWSDCSASCDGGTRYRDRVCVEKKGEKETCFGNWPAKDRDGNDKFSHLKVQTHKCNEHNCPEDSIMMEWLNWDTCPLTCGHARQRRRRGCNPAIGGGKTCPKDRKKYEQWRECKLPECPDPQWTAWSPWGDCSLTCGLGVKSKVRTCLDTFTQEPMQPGLDCIGGGTFLEEKCKNKDCPIDGQWTQWLNWGECSVLCGPFGTQVRRRYCAQPLPQFGGKDCPGISEQYRKCENNPPCPQHCQWSLWGSWSDCTVSCGRPGEGVQQRGRHKARKAMNGGLKCSGENMESRICPHQRMKQVRENIKAYLNPIYFCPVDCMWAQWQEWSSCPECYGDMYGFMKEELLEYEQTRQRKVLKRAKYGGKRCARPVELETRVGECKPDSIVKPCPEWMGAGTEVPAFVGYWAPWGPCQPCEGEEKECSKGVRKRQRPCIGEEGQKCKEKTEEEEQCSTKCPPAGWSQWENWSNCPVTCGRGQRARRRFCMDDNKDEMRGKSTCRGIARETQKCDMGECGSVQELEYEGNVDPVKKYQEEAKRRNPKA